MASEEKRFWTAFWAELKEDVSKAPGPTAINRRMGHGGKLNRLNGRLAKARRKGLEMAGFKKNPKTGRWEK